MEIGGSGAPPPLLLLPLLLLLGTGLLPGEQEPVDSRGSPLSSQPPLLMQQPSKWS